MRKVIEVNFNWDAVPSNYRELLDNGGSELIKLAEACHATAANKGWWESPRPTGEAYALMHSELSEALEAFRGNLNDDKVPEHHGIDTELADTVIRILDWMAYHKILGAAADTISRMAPTAEADLKKKGTLNVTFPEFVNMMHKSLAISDNFHGSPNEAQLLGATVHAILVYGHFNRPKLLEALYAKAKFNESRPYRHGGKAC